MFVPCGESVPDLAGFTLLMVSARSANSSAPSSELLSLRRRVWYRRCHSGCLTRRQQKEHSSPFQIFNLRPKCRGLSLGAAVQIELLVALSPGLVVSESPVYSLCWLYDVMCLDITDTLYLCYAGHFLYVLS